MESLFHDYKWAFCCFFRHDVCGSSCLFFFFLLKIKVLLIKMDPKTQPLIREAGDAQVHLTILFNCFWGYALFDLKQPFANIWIIIDPYVCKYDGDEFSVSPIFDLTASLLQHMLQYDVYVCVSNDAKHCPRGRGDIVGTKTRKQAVWPIHYY